MGTQNHTAQTVVKRNDPQLDLFALLAIAKLLRRMVDPTERFENLGISRVGHALRRHQRARFLAGAAAFASLSGSGVSAEVENAWVS